MDDSHLKWGDLMSTTPLIEVEGGPGGLVVIQCPRYRLYLIEIASHVKRSPAILVLHVRIRTGFHEQPSNQPRLFDLLFSKGDEEIMQWIIFLAVTNIRVRSIFQQCLDHR